MSYFANPFASNQQFASYRATVTYPTGAKEGPFPTGYFGEDPDDLALSIARSGSVDAPVGTQIVLRDRIAPRLVHRYVVERYAGLVAVRRATKRGDFPRRRRQR